MIHEGKEVDGLCCPDGKILDVAVDLKDQDKTDYNLIHELTHGFMFEGGLYQVIPRKIIEIICEHNAKVITKNFRLISRE